MSEVAHDDGLSDLVARIIEAVSYHGRDDHEDVRTILKEVLTVKPRTVSHHYLDEEGNPAGGTTFGRGFCISWQRGPLGRDEDRVEPNGAYVEDLIDVVIDRLKFYQSSKFATEYNEGALSSLNVALDFLQRRTEEREDRGVEGTMIE